MPDVAKLVVEVTPKGIKDAQAQLDALAKSSGAAGKQAGGMMDTFRNMQAVMQGPVAAFRAVTQAMGQVYAIGKDLVDSYGVQERAVSNLNAVLRATGGTVGKTSSELLDMASAFQEVTLFGDEAIIQMNAVLLGFRSIQGDTFDRTTEAILDMSTVMGTDLVSSANMLGKALDSPTQGMAALSRVGFVWTDQQRQMIEQMEESGDLLGAQNIILGEVEKAFGGAARAAGETASGAFVQFNNTVGDLKEGLGELIADGLKPHVQYLNDIVKGWTDALAAKKRYQDAAENINLAFRGQGGDIQKAISDIQEILKLAETDRFKFFERYVGLEGIFSTARLGAFTLPKLDLNATENEINEYRVMLRKLQADLQAVADAEERAWLELGPGGGRAASSGTPAADPIIAKRIALEKETQDEIEFTTRLLRNKAITEEDASARVLAAYQREIEALTRLGYLAGPGSVGGQRVATLAWYLGEGLGGGGGARTFEGAQGEEDNPFAQMALAAEALYGSGGVEYLDDMMAKLKLSEEEAKKLEEALGAIGASLASFASSAYLETFDAMGRALIEASGAGEFAAMSIESLAESIITNLPRLLFYAGLQLLGTPAWSVGVGLIAASGIAAIGAGAYGAAKSEIQANAMGGVYNSPSLSAYSGQIVDRPTMFAFARGAGLMGEAGPEAILPLSRGSDGKLGVKAGGAGVSIVINNNARGATASAEEATGPDGEKQIIITVENVMRAAIGSGRMDGPMGRFGVRPVGVRA